LAEVAGIVAIEDAISVAGNKIVNEISRIDQLIVISNDLPDPDFK